MKRVLRGLVLREILLTRHYFVLYIAGALLLSLVSFAARSSLPIIAGALCFSLVYPIIIAGRDERSGFDAYVSASLRGRRGSVAFRYLSSYIAGALSLGLAAAVDSLRRDIQPLVISAPNPFVHMPMMLSLLVFLFASAVVLAVAVAFGAGRGKRAAVVLIAIPAALTIAGMIMRLSLPGRELLSLFISALAKLRGAPEGIALFACAVIMPISSLALSLSVIERREFPPKLTKI